MSRHLGDLVSAYVDRRLPGPALAAWDRHVVVCAHCRYAVDQERVLLASLRNAPAPGVSESLHALLLGLGDAPANARFVAAAGLTGGPSGPPPVPTAPFQIPSLRLPTVPPAAPPRHRSARRSALIAGLAAGASAAAAWTVGFTPAATATGPSLTPAQARVGAPNGLSAAYSGMLSFPVSQVARSTTPAGAQTTSTTETPGR